LELSNFHALLSSPPEKTKPRSTSTIKISRIQSSRDLRLQVKLTELSIGLYTFAWPTNCCWERLNSLGNKLWRGAGVPSQESIQDQMLLSSPTLNPMLDLSRMAMLSLVEKVKTMPRQVGERETANTRSLLSWRARRRLANMSPKCVGKRFWI